MPTLAKAALTAYDKPIGVGLVGPGAMHADIAYFPNAAVVRALNARKICERELAARNEPESGSPDELVRRFATGVKRQARIAKLVGIKPQQTFEIGVVFLRLPGAR